MNRLYPEKLLNIITIDALEEKLVESFKKYGASGYTILRAQGEGSSGVRSDMTGFDANIMIKVIMPPERLTAMLDSLERKINKGHHLTVFIIDVEVLSPEKFNARMR
ncbi:transcriptional regulator [Gammaproteobacteria bacterium AH-315-C21]|nr:transcriptional regulator [Gammaproteobacteria bacterium AH-315-C21]